MKKLIYLLFISTCFFGFSQQKELSIENDVLGYAKGLYPSILQNSHWLNDADIYVFKKENELLFSEEKTQNIIQTFYEMEKVTEFIK